jgi:hypothetical protein
VSSADNDRAILRFVAGVSVDEDALAEAIAARAVDRAAVVEALVGALLSPEATARLRAAERVARMEDVAREVADVLTRIAVADIDRHVRAAASTALRTHDEPLPGEPPLSVKPPPRRSVPSIAFRRVAIRSGPSEPLVLLPLDRANAHCHGLVSLGDDGLWRVALTGLSAAFAGTRPVLRARGDDGPIVLGTATQAVTSDGAVTIIIARDVGTTREVERRLAGTVELTLADS